MTLWTKGENGYQIPGTNIFVAYNSNFLAPINSDFIRKYKVTQEYPYDMLTRSDANDELSVTNALKITNLLFPGEKAAIWIYWNNPLAFRVIFLSDADITDKKTVHYINLDFSHGEAKFINKDMIGTPGYEGQYTRAILNIPLNKDTSLDVQNAGTFNNRLMVVEEYVSFGGQTKDIVIRANNLNYELSNDLFLAHPLNNLIQNIVKQQLQLTTANPNLVKNRVDEMASQLDKITKAVYAAYTTDVIAAANAGDEKTANNAIAIIQNNIDALKNMVGEAQKYATNNPDVVGATTLYDHIQNGLKMYPNWVRDIQDAITEAKKVAAALRTKKEAEELARKQAEAAANREAAKKAIQEEVTKSNELVKQAEAAKNGAAAQAKMAADDAGSMPPKIKSASEHADFSQNNADAAKALITLAENEVTLSNSDPAAVANLEKIKAFATEAQKQADTAKASAAQAKVSAQSEGEAEANLDKLVDQAKKYSQTANDNANNAVTAAQSGNLPNANQAYTNADAAATAAEALVPLAEAIKNKYPTMDNLAKFNAIDMAAKNARAAADKARDAITAEKNRQELAAAKSQAETEALKKKQLEDAEKKRLADEAEQKRLADEAAKKAADEAERRRLADEAAKKIPPGLPPGQPPVQPPNLPPMPPVNRPVTPPEPPPVISRQVTDKLPVEPIKEPDGYSSFITKRMDHGIAKIDAVYEYWLEECLGFAADLVAQYKSKPNTDLQRFTEDQIQQCKQGISNDETLIADKSDKQKKLLAYADRLLESLHETPGTETAEKKPGETVIPHPNEPTPSIPVTLEPVKKPSDLILYHEYQTGNPNFETTYKLDTEPAVIFIPHYLITILWNKFYLEEYFPGLALTIANVIFKTTPAMLVPGKSDQYQLDWEKLENVPLNLNDPRISNIDFYKPKGVLYFKFTVKGKIYNVALDNVVEYQGKYSLLPVKLETGEYISHIIVTGNPHEELINSPYVKPQQEDYLTTANRQEVTPWAESEILPSGKKVAKLPSGQKEPVIAPGVKIPEKELTPAEYDKMQKGIELNPKFNKTEPKVASANPSDSSLGSLVGIGLAALIGSYGFAKYDYKKGYL